MLCHSRLQVGDFRSIWLSGLLFARHTISVILSGPLDCVLAQVNYCQGMAFVAGVILMYLPEEPAFRMLMALMAERGANLRRLFTPGLEGLKAELRKFEWLMQRHYPALAAHLVVRPAPCDGAELAACSMQAAHGEQLFLVQDASVVPVLYASQWFLTLFSCPFPAAFACRIIDTIIAEGHSQILLQARFRTAF